MNSESAHHFIPQVLVSAVISGAVVDARQRSKHGLQSGRCTAIMPLSRRQWLTQRNTFHNTGNFSSM
jgi:hypothetical protein